MRDKMSTHRNRELKNLWRKYVSESSVINYKEICRRIAASPASRFFIGVDHAFNLVSRIARGEPPIKTNPLRRKMHADLYNKVRSIIDRRPHLELRDAVAEAVYSQAPSFYLTWQSIYVILCKTKRQSK